MFVCAVCAMPFVHFTYMKECCVQSTLFIARSLCLSAPNYLSPFAKHLLTNIQMGRVVEGMALRKSETQQQIWCIVYLCAISRNRRYYKRDRQKSRWNDGGIHCATLHMGLIAVCGD